MIGTKHTIEEAKSIGDKLGLNWKRVKPDTLKAGMDVEEEHNDNNPIDNVNPNVAKGDKKKIAKIAIAHIGEIPDYYKRLEKMEGEGKKNILKKIIKTYGKNNKSSEN